MQKFVVIDTNVLVSALITRNENSPTVKILKMLSLNKIVPVFNAEILEEYKEVLLRPKFKLPKQIVEDLICDIKENGLFVKTLVKITEKLPDPKDVVFYAVTLSAKENNTILVTGNIKHFPIKPFILTPAEFIQKIEK